MFSTSSAVYHWGTSNVIGVAETDPQQRYTAGPVKFNDTRKPIWRIYFTESGKPYFVEMYSRLSSGRYTKRVVYPDAPYSGDRICFGVSGGTHYKIT